jgi:putative nicotinate phosphoribosyltransferase
MIALKTDRYEFSMLQAFINSGKVNDKAVFEVFTRKLPAGRRYGVFGGLNRLLPLIEKFRFSPADLDYLASIDAIDGETQRYLANYSFRGQIWAYEEGDLFFPNSPVLRVEGTLGDSILLETLILSVLNFDSAIATTAARMVSSAQGRPIIEMGSRRVNEDAAMAAARAAYMVGFSATSNLAAGKEFKVPTTGTAAHAFTLAYETEKDAFRAQIEAFGPATTLLVDTYNIEQGIRNAVEVAGTGLKAIRIDSGDLAREATKARHLLDSMGAYATKIIVTSDLDELIIKDLQEAPIDGYGVGTKLVSSAPMGFVYKLVEIEGRPVAKKAKDKVSIGGLKIPFRMFDEEKRVSGEFFARSPRDLPSGAVGLSGLVFSGGKATNLRDLGQIILDHQKFKAELPEGEQKVWNGDFGPFTICEEWRDA